MFQIEAIEKDLPQILGLWSRESIFCPPIKKGLIMQQLELFTGGRIGVEAAVVRELKHLGYSDTRTDNGRIYFTGDYEAICRTNLWLRCAGRVYVLISRFEARTF